MRKLFITIFLAAATAQAQDIISIDSTKKDSTDYSNYHSYSRELTDEEMEELIERDEVKKNRKENRKEKTNKVKEAVGSDVKNLPNKIKYSPSVQEHMNQNKQDYTNFYYRKTKRTLLGLLFP